MILIFSMSFVALLFGIGLALLDPAMAQSDLVPHGIAEWAAGVELWILGGVAIVLSGVYGWLILYALANRERLVRLESWREATELRLDSGKGAITDLKDEIALVNSRLSDIGGDLSFVRGILEGSGVPAVKVTRA